MKLKTTRLNRTCKCCGTEILKGSKYAQKTKSIKGRESINGGKSWFTSSISYKIDLCTNCI